jgi:hypothetical protein
MPHRMRGKNAPPGPSVFRNENKTFERLREVPFCHIPYPQYAIQASQVPGPRDHFPEYGVFINFRAVSAWDWSPPPEDAIW